MADADQLCQPVKQDFLETPCRVGRERDAMWKMTTPREAMPRVKMEAHTPPFKIEGILRQVVLSLSGFPSALQVHRRDWR